MPALVFTNIHLIEILEFGYYFKHANATNGLYNILLRVVIIALRF